MTLRIASTLLLACAVAPAPAADARKPATGADADVASQWRGTVVPPYLSGMRELGGTCIGPGPGGDAMCAVSVSVLRDEQSGIRTILARAGCIIRTASPSAAIALLAW